MPRGFEVCSKYKDAGLKAPIRKTKTSVGYDFYSATDITIPSIFKGVLELLKGNKVSIKPTLIPTGYKAYFEDDEVLFLANKSSFPIKKRSCYGK